MALHFVAWACNVHLSYIKKQTIQDINKQFIEAPYIAAIIEQINAPKM